MKLIPSLLAAAALAASAGVANAETFTLRMGGGHTTGTTYVKVFDTFFADEVAKRVKAQTDHEVRFIKAWGGSVAKVDGAVEAVQKGSLDIGLSPIGFEQARAGLLNYSAYMPFTSDDPVLQQKVATRMLKEVPALQASMKPYNAHVLAQMVTEAYSIATTFDVQKIEDLNGKRIAMTGTNAPLFIPTGAVPVTLGIGDHYQAIQNGLAEGSLFWVSGMEAFKLREVAKVWTKTGFGSYSTLAAFMNLDTRARLPKEVVSIIDKVAAEATIKVAEMSKQRDADVEAAIRDKGVKVHTLSTQERGRWAQLIKDLPSKAAKELDAKGQPATEVLKTYVRFLGEAGYKFPFEYPL
ncbi:TRAP transporter substrate-binding protein DctP [Ramlibacter sp. AN1015]|uniref:TRAP transporter substrate-binding protein DctP n=1 Tax=Ramlibacter sp. AN1015 TaxID=3133428 RepID=UPI0030C3D7B4